MQKSAGVACLYGSYCFRRALGDDESASDTSLWSEVHDPVRGLDHIQVVLDDHYRVAVFNQSIESAEQLLDVIKV